MQLATRAAHVASRAAHVPSRAAHVASRGMQSAFRAMQGAFRVMHSTCRGMHSDSGAMHLACRGMQLGAGAMQSASGAMDATCRAIQSAFRGAAVVGRTLDFRRKPCLTGASGETRVVRGFCDDVAAFGSARGLCPVDKGAAHSREGRTAIVENRMADARRLVPTTACNAGSRCGTAVAWNWPRR